jgi:hypothetical protein
MRRGIAIFLALFIGLGPLSATLQASDDMRLPACCRRHGAHHCAMSDALIARMVEAASGTPILNAPSHCPLYPSGGCATVARIHALTPSLKNLPLLLAHEQTPPSTRTAARAIKLRTQADWGPPIAFFC